MEAHVVSAGYEVPTYKVAPGASFFHFLHGNVPGHQIDFIYRPDVPQPPLARQHFSHLSRLVKYIEPRHGSAYAFAIGNLSRDDTQYEPGHGGVAFIFGLRIKGAKDHAGRQDPPFCHSAAIIDRHMDGAAIYETAVDFYNRLLPDQESQIEGSDWYHNYVAHAQNPDALIPLLKMYLEGFEDLRQPGPSGLTFRWTVENANPPKRVVIIYPDRVDFPTLAYCMARITNVLVESDIKWTAISNGREQDVAGGLTVRFVPRREATAEPQDVVLMYLEQVPESPADIAAQLFDAHEVRVSQLPDFRRHFPNPQQATANGRAPASTPSGYPKPATEERARPWDPPAEAPVPVVVEEDPATRTAGLGGLVQVVERKDSGGVSLPLQPTLAAELKKKQQRQQFSTLIGVGLLVVVVGVIAAVWFASTPTPVGEDAAGAASVKAPATGLPAASVTGKGGVVDDHPMVIEPPPGPTATTKPGATSTKVKTGKPTPTTKTTSTATPAPTPAPARTRPF